MADMRAGALAQLHRQLGELVGDIRAVTLQTLNSAACLESAALRLDGRLSAIARAQTSLAAGQGATDLELLIGEELRASGIREDATTIATEPRLSLNKRAATAVALGLHELATLSSDGPSGTAPGILEISWSMGIHEGQRAVRIVWRERQQPPLASQSDARDHSADALRPGDVLFMPDLKITQSKNGDVTEYLLWVTLA